MKIKAKINISAKSKPKRKKITTFRSNKQQQNEKLLSGTLFWMKSIILNKIFGQKLKANKKRVQALGQPNFLKYHIFFVLFQEETKENRKQKQKR